MLCAFPISLHFSVSIAHVIQRPVRQDVITVETIKLWMEAAMFSFHV